MAIVNLMNAFPINTTYLGEHLAKELDAEGVQGLVSHQLSGAVHIVTKHRDGIKANKWNVTTTDYTATLSLLKVNSDGTKTWDERGVWAVVDADEMDAEFKIAHAVASIISITQ